MKKKSVEIELRLPQEVAAKLHYAIQVGILGKTMDEVVEHVLKQSLWDMHLRALAKSVGGD
jgi:hypothetical protein